MTIHELQMQAVKFNAKQLLRIKGGNDPITTQDNYIGGVDTDAM